ncbi:endolytic transglycosylase MltG [Collinsella stercoris]|uniref:endolytic transglycosylase MltG n=1 Tax=Collinsella stercoris TaxID=147206 RepID=UPI0023F01623|nr:endolytic transglycosylase MltG [Collinsella stercoris]
MANVPGSHRQADVPRPAGARFRTPDPASAPSQRPRSAAYPSHGAPSPAQAPAPHAAGSRFAQGSHQSYAHQGSQGPTYMPQRSQGAYARGGARPPKKGSPVPVVIGVLIAIAVVAGAALFLFPRIFGGDSANIEAGQQVSITIPEGSSGDAIATILVENHIITDSGEYYAAVKKLNAEMSLKPGDYQFETLQDPLSVVKQLVAGPNLEGVKLTVPEGKTVEQTAQLVEDAYGISADEFISQAKASAYAGDYPFLADAGNDSLEGFLYPKTYTFAGTPTADEVIRAMLDQYQLDVFDAFDFDAGRAAISATYGIELSDYELLTLASIVEREGLNADQRAHVASVFLNRLAGKGDFAGRPYLQSDATLMYETGGAVTAEDIQGIDSPYNSYQNAGLPPTPICSPSSEAILATLEPTDSDDLYFYITQDEEYFSQTYDEHMQSWE